MKRILSLIVLLAIMAVAGPAFAGKPSIAILGLEVIDDGASMDAKATQFAEQLSEALRQRAKTGTGPYTLAPGSDKNLIEMKLLSNCENEANNCMAAIGAELAADRLLFGKVEKRGNGYQVSLKLLNVGTKTIEKSTTEIVPFAEASGTALTGWGKKLYAKISGVSNQGTLVIKANVDRGTVYLDGEVKGNLVGGTARIAGLDAGDYKLTVEAECYLRHEGKVSVDGGKDTTENVDLEKNALGSCGGGGGGGGDGGGGGPGDGGGGGVGPGGGGGDGGGGIGGGITTGHVSNDDRPGGGARALFWTSTAIAAVGAGTWAYGYFGLIKPNEGSESDRDDTTKCHDSTPSGSDDPNCKDGLTGKRLTQIGIPLTFVAAGAAAFFYYKGYVSSRRSGNAERPLARRKRNVIIAPTVSAKEVGGVLHIEF
jgi:hypothetical protein